MKRRKVLKQLGLGVTAGLALPWLSSCVEDETGPEVKYDGVVGIIGAGAAGLYAADYLIAKGIKVKIFEASGRMGGRVRSVRSTDLVFPDLIADFPIELGADKILGSDSEWGNIVNLLKIPSVDFRASGAVDKFILDDVYKTLEEIENDPDFVALLNFKNNILPGFAGGGSVQEAAALNDRVDALLNSWLGNTYGTSADRISARGLGEALAMIEHDGNELILRNNPMSNVLLSRFNKAADKVQLNKAVLEVDYSSEIISLAIQDTLTQEVTSEQVDKLILTVPVSILKSGDINFAPALPADKLTAMSRIGMDASIRVILEFKRSDFFGNETAIISGGTEGPWHFLSGAGRSDQNKTFSITINGSKAEELTTKTDLEIVEQVLEELDLVFGPPGDKASVNVRRKVDDEQNDLGIIYVVQDWTKEPFIKGGQSYPLVGGTNADRITLAASVEEKLYFAGEATDITGEFGTVSGALKSGKRAAEEVIESIVG